MTFRPTLIERAFQLAENGSCQTASAIKAAMSEEGFTQIEIQMHLNGSDVARTLSQKCKKNYIAPPDDDAVSESAPDDKLLT